MVDSNTIIMNINITFFTFHFRLSGFMLPSPIVSTGSILALWFTTDFAVSAQGFKAIYEGKKHWFLPFKPIMILVG